jgi:hypothetical protein
MHIEIHIKTKKTSKNTRFCLLWHPVARAISSPTEVITTKHMYVCMYVYIHTYAYIHTRNIIHTEIHTKTQKPV